jgi:hypothetical protein
MRNTKASEINIVVGTPMPLLLKTNPVRRDKPAYRDRCADLRNKYSIKEYGDCCAESLVC